MDHEDQERMLRMDEHLAALRREVHRLQALVAQLEARQRIARGEDGFDG